MKRIFVLLIVLIVLTSCQKTDHYVEELNPPIVIPNADIVFRTVENGTDSLGFYSLENGFLRSININKNLITPFYLDPDTIIAINKPWNSGLTEEAGGSILILENNQYTVCKSNETTGGYLQPYNNDSILFTNVYNIFQINRINCSIEKSILIKEDLSIFEGNSNITSFSLTSDGKFLVISVLGREHKMIGFYLPEKRIMDYKKIGLFPSISPNNKQIAYLGIDGIHVMNITGENDSLVIPYKFYNGSNFELFNRGIPPKPKWSGNGFEIIYHKCNQPIGDSCENIEDYDIFAYNFNDKKETLLIHEGVEPSWEK